MSAAPSSQVRIVAVTAPDGTIVEPAWLAASESVHRELRPQIPAGYDAKMRAIFEGGGRMAVAVSGEQITALCRKKKSEASGLASLYCTRSGGDYRKFPFPGPALALRCIPPPATTLSDWIRAGRFSDHFG